MNLRIATLLLLMTAVALPGKAAGRRRVTGLTPTATRLSLTFIATDSGPTAFAENRGSIDLGVVTQASGSRVVRDSAIVVRHFGLLVGGSPDTTVRVSAFVENSDAQCIIRLNGIVLTSSPRLIDPQLRLGVVTHHTLEIEVPASVSAGAISSAIGWELTTN